MGHIIRSPVSMVLVALALASIASASLNHPNLSAAGLEKPLPIPQGPMHVSNTLTGDPYWFQQGVQGDSSTYKSVGVRATIRSVYDNVNNDAHSYWIGTILANDAFVQVGYLNELTTTNHYYCCAWFFEYFPPGNTVSPPIIGPARSAGPIGSWHTYSMNYNSSAGVGVWSFYMDNQYLGSSPTSGQLYYLGSTDIDSGTHAPAALSEVAETTVNTDVIGPAEFKNFQYETSADSWNDVSTGHVHWGYGATSSTNLPNPYSVAEIVGIPNDFLTGSNVPYPGPTPGYPGIDECGKSAQSNAVIWPVFCLGQTTTAFSFVDENGTSLVPNWISLNDSSGHQIFYTDYANYIGLNLPSPTGQWIVDQVSWHAVNIATNPIVNMNTSQTFSTLAFSATLAVVGYIYSLPVKDATVILYLPDSTNQTLKTDDSGEAVLIQIPPSSYSVHIAVPYGIAASQIHNILGPGSLVAKVFSLPELVTIIVPPVFVAVLVTVLAVRKERQRLAEMPIQTPMPTQPPAPRPSFCMSCGQPLPPIGNFCARCGTPVRTMVP